MRVPEPATEPPPTGASFLAGLSIGVLAAGAFAAATAGKGQEAVLLVSMAVGWSAGALRDELRYRRWRRWWWGT